MEEETKYIYSNNNNNNTLQPKKGLIFKYRYTYYFIKIVFLNGKKQQ